MTKVKNGDTVKVHYTGQLKDGTVFDTSVQREPLEFTLGQGQLIPGFEKAVLGLEIGGTTTANIPSAEAYGEVNPDMILEVGNENLPEGLTPEVGMQLQLNQPNGQPLTVVVSEINEGSIKIDANHPLAGKDLIFNIELVEIV